MLVWGNRDVLLPGGDTLTVMMLCGCDRYTDSDDGCDRYTDSDDGCDRYIDSDDGCDRYTDRDDE